MGANSSSRQGFSLLILFIFIVLYGAYYYYSGNQDKKLADQVYNELVVVDGQLDNLKIAAESIVAQKQLNDKVINEVNQVTPDNFHLERDNLNQLIQQINYNLATQQKFESTVAFLTSVENDPKELKRNLKLLKIAARELKYQHNREVTGFNQQISVITNQVSMIKNQVSNIHTNKLQELELAKLKFISRKLAETAHSLNAAFYNDLVDDVLDTVIDDAESA